MTLRAFHLFFIAMSVILAAFMAAWAAGQYQTLHDGSYIAVAVASIVCSLGLVVYAVKFQRKTRNL
jgi:hypothetical protein